MTDINLVKRSLEDRILTVCEYLLPAGRKDGHEFRVGDTSGSVGKSLGVRLTGTKVGIWSDFATGEGGDIIDLWCVAKGQKIADGLKDMQDFLGIERPKFMRPMEKQHYSKPPKPKCSLPQNTVAKYLTEKRLISPETFKKFKIGQSGNNIIFPFLNPAGKLLLAKSRPAEDGGKPKPTAAGCEPILFGWQAVPDTARDIFITEGEIDAMSLSQYGFPALSVPYGGGGGQKQKWIESEFENLDRFERIYLVTDTDTTGEEAAKEIADRLGRHRCYRVRLPHKDANDCLQHGLTTDQIQAAIDASETLDPAGLYRPRDFKNDLLNLFYPAPEEHVGYRTAYRELGDKLLFRPAEVTIWTGASGSGKSQMISDNIPAWIEQGSRICLASLEMVPKQTLKRLVKQAGCIDRPTKEYLFDILEWLDRGLLLYGLVGKADVETLLEVFDYARSKYGCDQFVIDSLMRLGIAGDDYNGQEQVMFRVVSWAIENNVHVHFVAHARKTFGGGPQNIEDVKGASELGANAFNILAIWRNRAAEENSNIPGCILNVAKQRNGDFEGKISMNFNQETYQYSTVKDGDRYGRKYVKLSEKQAAC